MEARSRMRCSCLSDNRRATVDDGRSFGPVPVTGMLKVIWPRMNHGEPARALDDPGLERAGLGFNP